MVLKARQAREAIALHWEAGRDHSNPDAITVRMFPDVQIVGLVLSY